MAKPRMKKAEKEFVNSVIQLAFTNPELRKGNSTSIDLEKFNTLSVDDQNKFFQLITTKTR
jgi:hypothetical protein